MEKPFLLRIASISRNERKGDTDLFSCEDHHGQPGDELKDECLAIIDFQERESGPAR